MSTESSRQHTDRTAAPSRVKGWLVVLVPSLLFFAAVAFSMRTGSTSDAHANCAEHGEHTAAHSGTGYSAIDYWTGNGNYMPRVHCMVNAEGKTDWPWVIVSIILTGGVVTSYLIIFRMWLRCHYAEQERDRNKQLLTLAWIFLLCAICGYVMSMLAFVWPAYRLLAGCLVVLNAFSWRFALNSREFQLAFCAKRVERELTESLQHHNQRLTQTVEDKTRELRTTIDRLDVLTKTDVLTNLANRAGLSELLNSAVRHQQLVSGHVGVMFLDFDQFKHINDSLGHDAGDALLVEAAVRLRTCASGADTKVYSARLGGDEFVVVMSPLQSQQQLIDLSETIHRAMSEPFDIHNAPIRTRVSIGLTSTELSGFSADHLLRDADLAMYEAKSRGRGRSQLFDQGLRRELSRKLHLESELRSAIFGYELTVAYQPIVSLSTGRVAAFEALLRWQHPTLGAISPAEFIPISEESGQIERLTWFVVDQVLSTIASLPMLDGEPPYFTINIPPLLLRREGFVAELAARVASASVSPRQICLEITESGFMRDAAAMTAAAKRVRDCGMRVTMDDFGTGHSSLASLHELAIDMLKIDRKFIHSMTERRDYAAVVHAITSLARNLGMSVVAEGIETHEQVAQLQALDCEYAQGFLFARPMPAIEAMKFLQSPQPNRLAA